MTGQTEFSKEVESIGEKCGLEASSYQNLQKENCNVSSHCDQVNDPDNSYVFVTGTDGLIDDHVVEKENLVASKGFSVESAVGVQVENLIQEVDGTTKEGVNVNLSVISGNDVPPEQASLPEDQGGEPESDVVAEIKPLEFPSGSLENLVEPEMEVVGEQNGNSDNAVENAIKSVVDLEGSFDSSTIFIMETIGELNGDLGNVAEAEIKEITDSNPRIESSKTVEKEIVGELTGNFENEAEFETKSEDVNSIIESPDEPEIESVGVTGVKVVEGVNGVPGADTETFGNQNGNVVVQNNNVEKKVEDQTESENEVEASQPIHGDSYAHEFQNEIDILGAEVVASVDSPPIQDPTSETAENGIPDDVRLSSWTNSDVSGSEFVPNEEKEQTFRCGDEHVEVEVSSEKTSDVNGPALDINVNLGPELHDSAAATPKVLTRDVTLTLEGETLDGFGVNNKDSSNFMLEKEAAGDLQVQLDNAIGNNKEISCLQENEDTEKSQSDMISIPSPEGSSTDGISEGDTSVVPETKPFNFLVRIPRFGDESLKEKIRLAKVKADEMTKARDVIQVQVQEKRANCQTHGVDYEYAKSEDRSARRLVRSKRVEIDSIQSVINKAKNAASIKDANKRISDIEHMIQHETLPLKEEKLFIREIKQLKLLRGQISTNLGTEDEIKQALELKEEAEKHYKILRKELDVLKDNVLKAEAIAFDAERKYDHEIKKVKELQAKYRAANDVRQEAYAQWQNLRKELSEKNQYFFKYKDAVAAAHSYAYRRERESVYRLCTNQVEKFMELWNRDDEFRKEYISFNIRSTMRRLRTSDGRSLGPDEQPPILPSYTDERVHKRSIVLTPTKVDSISQNPELQKETFTDNVVSVNKPLKKLVENKNQTAEVKETAKSVPENGLATVSDRDVITAEVAYEEEPVKSKEEIELERKTEEIRNEEAESELREQRRLEELVRANEARERKKRQAEKLQMRAEMKAQKEAEQKEKEREKRMRKKEKKKASATDINDSNNHSDSGESSIENGAKEIEVTKEIPSVANKKYQKSKQSKSKSIPPTLRNRNRKKWQQYIYVGMASLFVLVLFWVGNIGLFSAKNLKRSGPFY